MKVTANIATYPPRKESLMKMLKSIKGQFDEVRVCFNFKNENEGFVDALLADGLIDTAICMSKKDLADNGKFFYLDVIERPEIYCTLDDDLIYPPDYREQIEHATEVYVGVVCYHGRRLLGTGHNYYKGHTDFRCLDDVHNDEVIDVPGTGVTAFSTEDFHPKGLANSQDLRMSDLVFALESAKQHKQIAILSHKQGWIRHIHNKETIYDTETKKGIKRQNEIADEIYRINYGKI